MTSREIVRRLAARKQQRDCFHQKRAAKARVYRMRVKQVRGMGYSRWAAEAAVNVIKEEAWQSQRRKQVQ
jgi:hypothetical protein